MVERHIQSAQASEEEQLDPVTRPVIRESTDSNAEDENPWDAQTKPVQERILAPEMIETAKEYGETVQPLVDTAVVRFIINHLFRLIGTMPAGQPLTIEAYREIVDQFHKERFKIYPEEAILIPNFTVTTRAYELLSRTGSPSKSTEMNVLKTIHDFDQRTYNSHVNTFKAFFEDIENSAALSI